MAFCGESDSSAVYYPANTHKVEFESCLKPSLSICLVVGGVSCHNVSCVIGFLLLITCCFAFGWYEGFFQ